MVDAPTPFQSAHQQHQPSSLRWIHHPIISDMDQPLPLSTSIYSMASEPYYDTTTKMSQMPSESTTRWLDPQTPDTMTTLWSPCGAEKMHANDDDDTKFHMIDAPFPTSSCSNTGDDDNPAGMMMISTTRISTSETTLSLGKQKQEGDGVFTHRRFTSPTISPPSSIDASNITSDKCNAKRPHLRRHSTSSSGSSSSSSTSTTVGGGGVKSHECGYCLRTFARRHDLERHTRVHTGIKPYVCPCCLRAFIRSDARGRHFRTEKACRGGPEILAFIKRNIRNTL
ncbi:predicted protein [Lichtheimia corymbifera JMRC:FSU:9682]|uniref:C2H2-type domain-containing protein n=1 Tax=Lichtheimia corymbifera JMRC:FSU:9682 TaxID=1263082 RepID=A0A068RRE1_9FUNG|nr:predicted protein [Lichtheimia corymbifera JMRC:FSU:9682]